MKEEPGIVYTEPKIEVKVPLRFCSECLHQQSSAAKDPCLSCMTNTKGEKWEPTKQR
jgi:hypothetical protein